MPYVSGIMTLLGGMPEPEWPEKKPKKGKGRREMPRWDLDQKTAKHWANKEANSSYIWAVVVAVLVLTLVLITAVASGAEAVGVNWMPVSDRLADAGKGWSTIKTMLWALAYMIGIPMTIAVVIKAAEVGQDILSFFWSCLRRRQRKRSIGICR